MDVPIYAKMVKELCVKNIVGEARDPPTMHIMRELSDLILGNNVPTKYEDPSNPIVITTIGQMILPNTFID